MPAIDLDGMLDTGFEQIRHGTSWSARSQGLCPWTPLGAAPPDPR